MENVLISINDVIALSQEEKARNNRILQQVTDEIIGIMKQKDPLFKAMYERKFYGGSFYDKLKVGNPDEFDLDLVFTLPRLIVNERCVKSSDQPGFVTVEFDFGKMLQRPEVERRNYMKLESLMNSNKYLSAMEVSKWMESLFTKVLKELPKEGTQTYFNVIDKEKPNEPLKIYIKHVKAGPAFTIKLSGKDLDGSIIQLDIDLVPCFQFTDEKNWPEGGYRPNNSTSKRNFLVVPKKPKGENFENSPVERYWRLSFQEQEREMIGKNLAMLKPAVRLLKKLRDNNKHNIASYFIKTVFLWRVQKEDEKFWSQSLSVVFMIMLKDYAECLRKKNIPYYWNDRFNLIKDLNDSTATSIAKRLQNIIAEVERNLCAPNIDPFVIGKFLVADYEKLKEKVSLGKKLERTISSASVNNLLNRSGSSDTPDSKNNTSPPLVSVLQFPPDVVDCYRQYSDHLEEKSKQAIENIMAQFNQSSTSSSTNTHVLQYLHKIDDKLDKVLEKVENIEEHKKESDFKIAFLEKQVRELQIANVTLVNKINKIEEIGVNLGCPKASTFDQASEGSDTVL